MPPMHDDKHTLPASSSTASCRNAQTVSFGPLPPSSFPFPPSSPPQADLPSLASFLSPTRVIGSITYNRYQHQPTTCYQPCGFGARHLCLAVCLLRRPPSSHHLSLLCPSKGCELILFPSSYSDL